MAISSNISIKGFGHYLPQKIQTSSELDKIYKKEDGWTAKKFGIDTRHIANEEETTSFMATKACIEAIEDANWEIGDFDAIIGACAIMEQPIPSTSILVQEKLGLSESGIICFDVNMTCLSFLMALDIISQYMQTKRIKRAIIFSSEIASCGLNYEIPHSSAIFGDGAAAICVEASGSGKILASEFKSYSSGIETSHLKSGGTKIRINDYESLLEGSKFYMNATGIFKAAGRKIPQLIQDILKKTNFTIDDIDAIIPHQASSAGIEFLRHIFKGNESKIIDIFPKFGNQIAASIPMALYFANKKGKLTKGNKVLLLGTAAGVSIGTMVLEL